MTGRHARLAVRAAAPGDGRAGPGPRRDHVVDSARDDFTGAERCYDVIIDLVGNHSLSARRRALEPNGVLVLSSGGGNTWVVMSSFIRQKLRPVAARRTREDLEAAHSNGSSSGIGTSSWPSTTVTPPPPKVNRPITVLPSSANSGTTVVSGTARASAGDDGGGGPM